LDSAAAKERTAADVEDVAGAGEEAAAVFVEAARHHPVCANGGVLSSFNPRWRASGETNLPNAAAVAFHGL